MRGEEKGEKEEGGKEREEEEEWGIKEGGRRNTPRGGKKIKEREAGRFPTAPPPKGQNTKRPPSG